MSKHIFTGAGVALITPMHSDGSVNYEELARLLEFQVENGTDAIIACGTTGEAATLTVKEHCEVLSFVCERINGRIPVIAGTGSNDTNTAIELSSPLRLPALTLCFPSLPIITRLPRRV